MKVDRFRGLGFFFFFFFWGGGGLRGAQEFRGVGRRSDPKGCVELGFRV